MRNYLTKDMQTKALKNLKTSSIWGFVYFISAYGALVLFGEYYHIQVSPVWVASGVAAYATYHYGPKILPALWIASALSNFTISGNLMTAILIAAGNMVEAYIVAHWASAHSLQKLKASAKFIGAAFAGSLFAAVNGAIWVGGDMHTAYAWLLGDFAGVLTIFPLLVTFPALWQKLSTDRMLSYVLILTIIVNALVFLPHVYSVAFISLAAVEIVTILYGISGGSLALLITLIFAIIGALTQAGPFSESILLIQVFIAVCAVCMIGVNVGFNYIIDHN